MFLHSHSFVPKCFYTLIGTYLYYVVLDKLALLVVSSLFERYVYTRGSETKGPSQTLCSWSNLSYRGTKVLQVIIISKLNT